MFAVGGREGKIWTRAWRIDDGTRTLVHLPRGEPETLVGSDETFVYYTVQTSAEDDPLPLDLRISEPNIQVCPTDTDASGEANSLDALLQFTRIDAPETFADLNRDGSVDEHDAATHLGFPAEGC